MTLDSSDKRSYSVFLYIVSLPYIMMKEHHLPHIKTFFMSYRQQA